MLPIDVKIVSMKVENGRAEIEIALPVCSANEEKGYYELYLWESGALSSGQSVNMQLSGNPAVSVQPVFYSVYPVGTDDECVIKIVQPHLWEGIEKPYLYHLEIYRVWDIRRENPADLTNLRELVCDRFLAIRTICFIPGKGYLLNGQPFSHRCVFYDSVQNISSSGEPFFWEGIMQKLRILAQMGANTLILGSGKSMSGEEQVILQKYCDRIGLLLYVKGAESGEDFGSAAIMGEELEEMQTAGNDNFVLGGTLFASPGLPTDTYYRCRSLWSREPFVYVGALRRQTDGGYALTVYTSCRKVTLMINDKVFGICEDTGEVLFQDISIKGFPVDITARTEEHNMTVRCYGV